MFSFQRTGIPVFLLCWQFNAYIAYPELIVAYLIMRYSANYPPSSTFNRKLVDIYKMKYPLLKQCNFSRKVPDPSRQSVNAFANKVTDKFPTLKRLDTMLDTYRIGKTLKSYRDRIYSNAIQHGFAWDVADNTRMIMGLPLLFMLLHYGDVGLYIMDSESYNHLVTQIMCSLIGGAYGSRITANWAMRTMVLTVTEKHFGLRSESGVYYGYKKTENVNKKNSMNKDYSETVSGSKVSSRKPKRK